MKLYKVLNRHGRYELYSLTDQGWNYRTAQDSIEELKELSDAIKVDGAEYLSAKEGRATYYVV